MDPAIPRSSWEDGTPVAPSMAATFEGDLGQPSSTSNVRPGSSDDMAMSSSTLFTKSNVAPSATNGITNGNGSPESPTPPPSAKKKFGAWDGVFVTVALNLIGVITFLRTGRTVGEAGVIEGFLIITVAMSFSLFTPMSMFGILSHTSIKGGDIYHILAHTMGIKFGATMGVTYILSQMAIIALYITGFAEAFSESMGWDGPWPVRFVGLVALVVLVGLVAMGVGWVVRLQILFILAILLALLDLLIGVFVVEGCDPTDPNCNQVVGLGNSAFSDNVLPAYTEGENFFTIFAVFFPAASGVLAGTNIYKDIRNPSENLPKGTIWGVISTYFLYVLIALLLAAVVTRDGLINDPLIQAEVSLVRWLYIIGVYLASLSSALTTLCGAPRVLRSIAMEGSVPLMKHLAPGTGSNDEPLRALAFISLGTCALLFIGQLDIIAPIVTMFVILAYTSVNYSFFALMQGGSRDEDEKRGNGELDSGIDIEVEIKEPEPTSGGRLPSPRLPKSLAAPVRGVKQIYELSERIGELQLQTGDIDVNDTHGEPWTKKFKYANKWVALIFALWGVCTMFLINWIAALCAYVFVAIIYVYIMYLNPYTTPGAAKYSLLRAFKQLMWNWWVGFKYVVTGCRKNDKTEFVQVTGLRSEDEGPATGNGGGLAMQENVGGDWVEAEDSTSESGGM
eukprot:Clim_evm89s225 gene=Clim_evmTU89s225